MCHFLKTASDFCMELWQDLSGIRPTTIPKKIPSYEELVRTQQCEEFRHLRDARLVVGAFRYGLLGEVGKPHHNSIESIIKRVSLYQETGNTELLLDIANLAEVEWFEGIHPNKHYDPNEIVCHVETRGD